MRFLGQDGVVYDPFDPATWDDPAGVLGDFSAHEVGVGVFLPGVSQARPRDPNSDSRQAIPTKVLDSEGCIAPQLLVAFVTERSGTHSVMGPATDDKHPPLRTTGVAGASDRWCEVELTATDHPNPTLGPGVDPTPRAPEMAVRKPRFVARPLPRAKAAPAPPPSGGRSASSSSPGITRSSFERIIIAPSAVAEAAAAVVVPSRLLHL